MPAEKIKLGKKFKGFQNILDHAEGHTIRIETDSTLISLFNESDRLEILSDKNGKLHYNLPPEEMAEYLSGDIYSYEIVSCGLRDGKRVWRVTTGFSDEVCGRHEATEYLEDEHGNIVRNRSLGEGRGSIKNVRIFFPNHQDS